MASGTLRAPTQRRARRSQRKTPAVARPGASQRARPVVAGSSHVRGSREERDEDEEEEEEEAEEDGSGTAAAQDGYRSAPCQLEPCAAVQPKQCASVLTAAFCSNGSLKLSTSNTVRPPRLSSSSSCWLKSQSYILPSHLTLTVSRHITCGTVSGLKFRTNRSM
mmetsp:Transcript_79806/g.223395  ORF Transcript_79806/g.223395 Transcript_79806/m.223395 type:complete len:164 (+) Transcript_79806:41-532(+)